MTDNEMAEKSFFFKELTYKVCRDKRSYIDGFLDGLNASGFKWHTMNYFDKKSFKKIPKNVELLTKYNYGPDNFYCVNEWIGDHWRDHSNGIFTWSKIPEYLPEELK